MAKGVWVVLLYTETNTDREGAVESSGRKRVVYGVDVIGVRSASEAAENQSFRRNTSSTCFRVGMRTGHGHTSGRVQI